MNSRYVLAVLNSGIVLSLLALFLSISPVLAADPTTQVRVVKYDSIGTTVLKEITVTYQWMESNLTVHGDGITHYYHQGPVFEGDMWDPDETANLKDKGAVRGTAVRDLCELVGGMQPDDELMLASPDGYTMEFGYRNVYEPLNRQGPIVLCWYKGEDPNENYGGGYPGKDAYNSAIQIVFMAQTLNSEGKYVFGNTDMQICLPEEKYQHFYDGYPSTGGLCGKWISEVRIYSEDKPVDSAFQSSPILDEETSESVGWIPVVLGITGLILVGSATYVWRRK